MMKAAGFNPAVVVETSPTNFQAWLKHPEPLSKEVNTAAARALAEKFGGTVEQPTGGNLGRQQDSPTGKRNTWSPYRVISIRAVDRGRRPDLS